MDLSAPILPGQEAAGIRIGAPIRDIAPFGIPEQLEDCARYRCGSVTIWVRGEVVDQIGVSEGYEGRLEGTPIGIGSTIGEIESHFHSSVLEDEDDTLVVAGQSGWCFENLTLEPLT